jgi:hypothetical protein
VERAFDGIGLAGTNSTSIGGTKKDYQQPQSRMYIATNQMGKHQSDDMSHCRKGYNNSKETGAGSFYDFSSRRLAHANDKTRIIIAILVYSNNNNNNNEPVPEGNQDTTTWITTKRMEFSRLPRVWLLHLERPKRNDFTQTSNIVGFKKNDHDDVSPCHFLDVPLDLDVNTLLPTTPCGGGGETSPPVYTLQGAILQVIAEDNDDKDDDNDNDNETCIDRGVDLEVHSVVLLRRRQKEHQQQQSWILIDDEKCELVTNDRALKLLGGTIEDDPSSVGKDNNNCKVYYGATLLVYSIIANDHGPRDWIDMANAIQLETQVRSSVNDVTVDPWHLVGRRLRVKWAKGKNYVGTITNYDTSSRKHQILYDDGDVREYCLSKKTIEWM